MYSILAGDVAPPPARGKIHDAFPQTAHLVVSALRGTCMRGRYAVCLRPPGESWCERQGERQSEAFVEWSGTGAPHSPDWYRHACVCVPCRWLRRHHARVPSTLRSHEQSPRKKPPSRLSLRRIPQPLAEASWRRG